MYCKYCGKEIEEESIFCGFCGKDIMKQARSDDNHYVRKNGIIYVAPKPKNSWESWYYDELINNGGHF